MNKANIPSVRAKIYADLLMLLAIILLIRTHFFSTTSAFSSSNLVVSMVSLGCWFVAGNWMGLYKDFRVVKFSFEWIVFLKTMIIYCLLASFIFTQVLREEPLSRSALVLYYSLIFVLLPIQKLVIRLIFKKIRNSKQLKRRVLIVGAGEPGVKFYREYVKNNHYGYALVGFVDDNTSHSINGHYLGKTSEIAQVIASHELDDIVVALPAHDEHQLHKVIMEGEKQGKRVKIIPQYDQYASGGRVHVGTLGTLPIISLRSLPLDVIENQWYKRLFDIVFSVLVIVFLLTWLIPIIGLIIKLTSKGPVFFRQERWGLNNRSITCFKFRTMVVSSIDVDESGTYQQARKNDPRATRIGKFLRKTNLDELPQFFNVLLGSMSVVGPRPHPVPLNLLSKDSINNYMMRHWVKPGVTGWAQVNGYRGETRKTYLMEKRVEFDMWYIENWTFWLDLQIVAQTVVNMVKREENAY